MEIDSPAHAGYGWQWGKDAGLGNMVICLGNRPWEDYCLQPPCGQLNPLNNHTYTWLGKIYKDLVSVFPKGEAFHMGGDEVVYLFFFFKKIVNFDLKNFFSFIGRCTVLEHDRRNR